MASDTVSSPEQAFSDLRQIVDQRLKDVQRGLAQAGQEERYQDAEDLARCAQKLADLRSELDSLADRLDELLESVSGAAETTRLPRGLKTPQDAYRIPILRTLVDTGGQADIGCVLERVRELMDDKLNEYDLAPLSDGETPRWRNTAQWARNSMREEGLIRDDTPRGTWAVSDKGRRWLRDQFKQ